MRIPFFVVVAGILFEMFHTSVADASNISLRFNKSNIVYFSSVLGQQLSNCHKYNLTREGKTIACRARKWDNAFLDLIARSKEYIHNVNVQ